MTQVYNDITTTLPARYVTISQVCLMLPVNEDSVREVTSSYF